MFQYKTSTYFSCIACVLSVCIAFFVSVFIHTSVAFLSLCKRTQTIEQNRLM